MAKTPATKNYIVTYFRNRDLDKAASGDSIALRVVEVEASSPEEAISKATTKTRTVVAATKRGRGKVKLSSTIPQGDALALRYSFEDPQNEDAVYGLQVGLKKIDAGGEVTPVNKSGFINSLDNKGASEQFVNELGNYFGEAGKPESEDFAAAESLMDDGLTGDLKPSSVAGKRESSKLIPRPESPDTSTEELVSGDFQAPVTESVKVEADEQLSEEDWDQAVADQQDAIRKIDDQIRILNDTIVRYDEILGFNARSEARSRDRFLRFAEEMDRFEARLDIRPPAIDRLQRIYGAVPIGIKEEDDTLEVELYGLQGRIEHTQMRDDDRRRDSDYYAGELANAMAMVQGLTLLRSELTGEVYLDPFAEYEALEQEEETEYETAPPVLYIILAVVALGALGATYGFHRTLLADLLRFALTLAMFFLGGAFFSSYNERDADYCDCDLEAEDDWSEDL
jgi:hypothetical protein